MDTDLMKKIVKFNAQASGRDKLFRLVQYSSKFAWWYLSRAHAADDTITKLKNLYTALSTTRKFLRLGKSIDFLHGALESVHISDDVLRLTITLSKINQAVYLIFDHIVLIDRIGLAKVDKEKWNKLSSQFWLVTLVLGITRDIYEIYNIFSHELRVHNARIAQRKCLNGESDKNSHRHDTVLSTRQFVWQTLKDNQALVLDLVKNLADLVLPLESLGHVTASPGVQGLMGTLSSAIGIITTWNPLLRVVPS